MSRSKVHSWQIQRCLLCKPGRKLKLKGTCFLPPTSSAGTGIWRIVYSEPNPVSQYNPSSLALKKKKVTRGRGRCEPEHRQAAPPEACPPCPLWEQNLQHHPAPWHWGILHPSPLTMQSLGYPIAASVWCRTSCLCHLAAAFLAEFSSAAA